MRLIAARYIARQVCIKIFLVMMVFATLQFVMGLAVDLPAIGHDQYTLWVAMHALLLSIPMQLYSLFSVIAFLGVVLGLGAMVRCNELVVFRASGLSLCRLMAIVLSVVALLTLAVTFFGETIAPIWVQQSMELKEKSAKAAVHSYRNYWWKSEEVFNNAQLDNKEHVARKMITLSLPLAKKEASIAYISVLKKEGKYWAGKNQVKTELGQNASTVEHQNKAVIHAHFNFSSEQVDRHTVTQSSWRSLAAMIKIREQEGRSAARFSVAYWSRIFQPIATLVLVLFAIPVVFSSHGRSTKGSRLLLGVGVGFLFYVTHRLFPPVGILLHWPPMLTVLAPLLLFFVVAVSLSIKVRR